MTANYVHGKGARGTMADLTKEYKAALKELHNLATYEVKHSLKFYPEGWADVVRQAALVGALGRTLRTSANMAKVRLAEIARDTLRDAPADPESDNVLAWVIRREYASAAIVVVEKL